LNIPLVINATTFHPRPGKDTFLTLDPHLGYAHGKNEALVMQLKEKYIWKDGFVIYSDAMLEKLQHPIILIFGGSTTDGVKYDHSWPEELSKLLALKGNSGTVINGATGGYSTNQELLKLVRDGLEFKPDIIISYSGVNDRGHYGAFPYPMVHTYQRSILEFLTQPGYSPLFPNTIYLLSNILLGHSNTRLNFTLGIPSSRSFGQQYERNMALMAAIAGACGASFYGIIQPNAYVAAESSRDMRQKGTKSAKYVDQLQGLYSEINSAPSRLPFVYSFVQIFDGEDGVYKEDGIHATLKGDQKIAQRVFDLIQVDLLKRKTDSRC